MLLICILVVLRVIGVKVCRMNVVEENVRLMFVTMVVWKFKSKIMVVVVIVVLVSMICVLFRLNILVCMVYRCDGCSFRLMMNSSSMILSLVVCMMVVMLVNSFRLNGLIMVLVVRYLVS